MQTDATKYQQLPTLLGVVGQQCCVRLRGPKSLTGFKLNATSANKYQHFCGSMQTDATGHNIVGPNNVGSVCMGLKLMKYRILLNYSERSYWLNASMRSNRCMGVRVWRFRCMFVPNKKRAKNCQLCSECN